MKKKKPNRHWKDKLAESVDQAFGIHESGKHYTYWKGKFENAEYGDDPISMARGLKRVPKRRNKADETPFWERDDSLVSLLLGSTPRRKNNALQNLFDDDFSLVSFFRVGLKSSFFLLNNVFRWANFRGTLPQPIAVFLVGAVALSTRRRNRLIYVALTLVIIRTIAESLHEYVYEDDDWDNDTLSLMEEDETEPSDNDYKGENNSLKER